VLYRAGKQRRELVAKLSAGPLGTCLCAATGPVGSCRDVFSSDGLGAAVARRSYVELASIRRQETARTSLLPFSPAKRLCRWYRAANSSVGNDPEMATANSIVGCAGSSAPECFSPWSTRFVFSPHRQNVRACRSLPGTGTSVGGRAARSPRCRGFQRWAAGCGRSFDGAPNVEPDIEVMNDPSARAEGRDPQINAP